MGKLISNKLEEVRSERKAHDFYRLMPHSQWIFTWHEDLAKFKGHTRLYVEQACLILSRDSYNLAIFYLCYSYGCTLELN